MTPTPARRMVVVALLVGLLLGAAVADRADRPVSHVRTRPESPQAAASDALSSSWYCPGGADVNVLVLNPDDEGTSGTITVFPTGGSPVRVPFEVGPATQAHVRLGDHVQGQWAAAVVDVDGGGVIAEQLVTGSGGFDTAPCASAASTTWWFPSGSTAKDATQTLALLNPFPDDAIVDLAFATNEGRRVPGDFQGLVVRAGSVTTVDVGSHLRRQDAVSTEVKARAGRIVAGQTLVRTGEGAAGVSSTLGASSLGDQWWFPDGLVSDTVAERYEVYNPGDREAAVDIELTLEQGEAEPFELTVPAQGRVSLALNNESRVPKGVPHAAVARSMNGVPVVVGRVIESRAPRAGRADTLGGRGPARRWGLAVGAATEALDEWVIVHNPGSAPATVTLTAMAEGQRVAVEGLQRVAVPGGKRIAFRVGEHIKRDPLPLVVDSTRPVVVERALYAVGVSGLASSLGIPL